MATNTENLLLMKKDPTTDGADTFNIQTMLNDNWDKVDAAVGARYGVCSDAVASVAKAAVLTDYVLLAGPAVVVKFTNGNSVAALTLNINSTGAKPVKYKGGDLTAAMIPAGCFAELTYDGTNYNLLNPAFVSHAGQHASGGADALAPSDIGGAAAVHMHTKSQITDFPTIPDQLSDLTDDATHRLVTDTEKTTWNGKQDAATAINTSNIGSQSVSYATTATSQDATAASAPDSLRLRSSALLSTETAPSTNGAIVWKYE